MQINFKNLFFEDLDLIVKLNLCVFTFSSLFVLSFI